jgi:CubicO group peptidase (beta-lactamase class C family)
VNRVSRELSALIVLTAVVCSTAGAASTGASDETAAAAASTQPALGDRLDRYMREMTAAAEFSGAVIVARQGRIVFARGYGLADRSSGRRNTAQTLFRMPGMRLFNTVAVYQLRDRKLVDLDASVCRYVPRCPGAWQPITVMALLQGKSGLPDVFRLRKARAHPPALSVAVDWMKARPVRFSPSRPGRNFDGSPAPEILLSYIIGRASGLGWLPYLQRRVFAPAGMRETTLAPARERRAVGYLLPDFRAGRDVEFTRPDPAHGIWSTVGDLFRFDTALSRGTLLRPTTREELFPAASHYVQGTHAYDRVQGVPRDGWFTMFGRHSPDRIFVGLLMNGRKAQYRFYDIELALAGIVARRTRTSRPIELPPEPVIAFSGELGAITLASSDGSKRVALTRPYAGRGVPVAWSKDGRTLLFNRFGGASDTAHVINANGTNEHKIANGQALAWAPDGRAVVAAGTGVWLISPDGRSRRRATAPGVRDARAGLAFSPDGRRVVWTRIGALRGPSTRSQLLITDLQAGQTRRLRTEPGFYMITADAWSPDGTSVSFVRRPRLGSFDGGVYLTDPEGRTLRLAASDGGGGGPSFSPSGLELAYNVGISCKIRIVSVQSRKAVTLPFEGCRPIWRRTG